MNSLDLYKIALVQYKKAMDYHDAIAYDKKIKNKKMDETRSFKQRKK